MKSINIGIVLCLLTVGAASFFVFSKNTTITTTELKVGEPIESVLVPDQISEIGLLGKNIFELKCQSCHGINAAGLHEIGPPLVHKIYEPSHHSDQSFYRAVALGVKSHHWPFGNMAAVEGLTKGDVKAIISYVRELQQENGIL
ncbi:MAG: cytochrome c [Paracoccaceae bacterium]